MQGTAGFEPELQEERYRLGLPSKEPARTGIVLPSARLVQQHTLQAPSYTGPALSCTGVLLSCTEVLAELLASWLH